jgi:hypothetical protein
MNQDNHQKHELAEHDGLISEISISNQREIKAKQNRFIENDLSAP